VKTGRHSRRIAVGLGLACAAVLSPAVSASDLSAQWRAVTQFDFKEAHRHFAAATGDEARLGEAVTLLNLQPRTSANLDRAAALLDQLATADPDVQATARYLRARIEHVHRLAPRPEVAAQLYEAVYRDFPDHPLGEAAAVKLALLRIYDSRSPSEPAVRLADAARLGQQLTSTDAQRDFALLLGRAYLHYGIEPATALVHLSRALELGVLSFVNRAEVLITVGELARELGHPEQAVDAYRAYLAENARTERAPAIRQRLVELAGEPPANDAAGVSVP
jgi:hypothetical protein